MGLALGGGGLTGTAFHAGVLTALAEHFDAREAEVIVGTSAGSTAAALMRAGFPPADYVPRVAGRPISARGREVLGAMPQLSDPPAPGPRQRGPASRSLARKVARRPWRYPPGVAVSAFLPEGTRSMAREAQRLGALHENWPELQTWIVAVDLDTGGRVVFGRDEHVGIADAVAASCAVPGYFEPAEINGRRFIDGGAYSMVSADLLADRGLDLVIVSAPLSTADWVARDPGNAARIPLRAQLAREVRMLRRSGSRVVVVAPDARLRSVMGMNSMVAAKRPPVAVAAQSYAEAVLRRSL